MQIPEPRSLTAEERKTWTALIGVLLRLPATLDTQLQRDASMSVFEYQVLSVLSEAPDHTLRMSELATFANSSLSRLSHVARRLEERGWLRRAPDPQDGRFTTATLTATGLEKLEAAAPEHVETVRRLVFAPLTQTQVRQLRDIGQRIQHAIDTDGATPRRT